MYLSRFLCRLRCRQSMGWLLRRSDDRLLEDIGLTRNDLEVLLDQGSCANRRPCSICAEPFSRKKRGPG